MNSEEQNLESDVPKPDIEIIPKYLIRKEDSRKKNDVFSEKFQTIVKINSKNPITDTLELESQDLVDQKSLNLKLGKKFVGFKLNFKKSDFDKYIRNIREKSEYKVCYACPGHQKDDYAWGNAKYNYKNHKLTIFNKEYPDKDFQIVENSLIDTKNFHIPLLYPTQKTGLEISKTALTKFARTFNRFDVIICTGAALGVGFYDIFIKEAHGYPCVFYVGKAESGKSTVMDFISSIYGLVGCSSHMSGNSTPNAISLEAQACRCIPVFIDDLYLATLIKLEPTIKNIFSGLGRERGKNTGLDKIQVYTSIVGSSNDFFPNPTPQILSRILYANMKEDDFDLKDYGYFHEESLYELSQILPLLLTYREHIPTIYKAVYAKICKLTGKKGKRHISNIAISCTMWVIINRIVGKDIVDWKKFAVEYDEFYQSEQNTLSSTSDTILNDISRLIDKNKLQYGEDYALTDGTNLRLNIPKYVEKYNLYLSQCDLLTDSLFRKRVQFDKRFNCKNTIPFKGIGRVISIDISDQNYLLSLVKELKRSNDMIEKSEQIQADISTQATIEDIIEKLGCEAINMNDENEDK